MMHRLPLRIASPMSGLPRLPEAYKYKPSVPAAATLSCRERRRSEEVIEQVRLLFQLRDQYTASEWQLSYGNLSAYIRFTPSCNGRIINLRFQSAATMTVFCDEVENDTPIRIDDIVGSMHTNEQDRDWPSAIQHLFERFH